MIDFGTLFSIGNITDFFIKAFAVTLSALYLVYAIVMYKQTQIMGKTLVMVHGKQLLFVSFVQILAAIFLIGLAVVIL